MIGTLSLVGDDVIFEFCIKRLDDCLVCYGLLQGPVDYREALQVHRPVAEVTHMSLEDHSQCFLALNDVEAIAVKLREDN